MPEQKITLGEAAVRARRVYAEHEQRVRAANEREARECADLYCGNDIEQRIRDVILGYYLADSEWDFDLTDDAEIVKIGLHMWRIILEYADSAHSGDCTNECHSCVRCRADHLRELAQRAIAAADALEMQTASRARETEEPR